MNMTPRASLGGGFRPEKSGLGQVVTGLFGVLLTGAALAVGALLALFAAAAVAVIAVCGSILVFLAGLAMRARRPTPVKAGGVIEARKVGHAWVAYGWDRTGR